MENCKVMKKVEHYHKQLKKSIEKNDTGSIFYCLYKFNKLNIGLIHLRDTKVGLTINKVIEMGGEVGNTADKLIYKWKKMLTDAQNETIEDTKEPNITMKHKRITDHNDDEHLSHNKINTGTCKDRNANKLMPKSDKSVVEKEASKRSSSTLKLKNTNIKSPKSEPFNNLKVASDNCKKLPEKDVKQPMDPKKREALKRIFGKRLSGLKPDQKYISTYR